MMSEQEIKDLFPGLVFDPIPHTYKVDGIVLPSVSSLIGNFHEPFDKEGISFGYAKKYGFTQQQVLDAWEGNAKKATDWGTLVHEFAEDYVKDLMVAGGNSPQVICKQSLGVVQFYNDLPGYIEVVACELQMYSKKFGYCGTCDVLAYNHKEGYYVIMDYKTNEKLSDDYNQKPLLHIPPQIGLVQDSFGKYTCQFSFYQILLEEVGIKVGSRVLIHLREQENKKLYKAIKTVDITKNLRTWLKSGKR